VRPDSPPSRPPRQRPASRRRPDRRSPKPHRPGRLAAHPSPSRRAAIPTPVSRPFPRPSPVRRCRAAVGSPCSAAATCRGPCKRSTPMWLWAMCPTWPRAMPALCNWAERDFGPVAADLNFIFSEYIQFITNSKICVGLI
jgi:hypothetical protein